jgi:hypothetical protein
MPPPAQRRALLADAEPEEDKASEDHETLRRLRRQRLELTEQEPNPVA